jgi:hypothetical protein
MERPPSAAVPAFQRESSAIGAPFFAQATAQSFTSAAIL